MDEENFILNDLENKHKLFFKLHAEYQHKIDNVDSYLNFEAFRDMKLIFELYSQTFYLNGYTQNDIKIEQFKLLTNKFSCFQKKDLYEFYAKRMSKEGNQEKSTEINKYLKELRLQCNWENFKRKKTSLRNIVILAQNFFSYNLFTLLASLVILFFLFNLIFSQAFFSCFELILVKRVELDANITINGLLNTIGYLFDFDEKMIVSALNWKGVILIIFIKSIYIVLIVNYIVSEIINRSKFS